MAHATLQAFQRDRGSGLAAGVAYFGVFSLFPLLLVFTTISSWVLADRPDLQARLADSAVADFPIVGDEIRRNLGSIQGSGLALVVGLLLALWAGLGATQQLQSAFNLIWRVEEVPGGAVSRLRSLAALAGIAAGALVTGVVTALTSSWVGGAPGAAISFVVSLAITGVAFVYVFEVLTAAHLRWRTAAPGAALAALAWAVLQTIGLALLDHQLRQASALYGPFGLLIGLLWWVYLQASITVVGAELNVVLARRRDPSANRSAGSEGRATPSEGSATGTTG